MVSSLHLLHLPANLRLLLVLQARAGVQLAADQATLHHVVSPQDDRRRVVCDLVHVVGPDTQPGEQLRGAGVLTRDRDDTVVQRESYQQNIQHYDHLSVKSLTY